MGKSLDSKCKKCRRAGEKLFLKGDRCDSPKCAMVRKAYPPGMHGKRMSRGLSEYGKQLAMKQKIKRIYGVMERQFRKHFDEVRGKTGVIGDLLMARLEMRLDNVVYKTGVANSRASARQLVGHGFIKINNKKVDIPSYELSVGDEISINDLKKGKTYLKNQSQILKNKKDFPKWLEFSPSEMKGKIKSFPKREDIDANVDPQIVVEYYSR